MRWHLAVTKLGDFFEAVEGKLPSTAGPDEEPLNDARSAVEESLVAINRTLEQIQ